MLNNNTDYIKPLTCLIMPIFKCEKCGCAENTALGWYWSRKSLADAVDLTDVGEQYYARALCSECAPTKYKGGKPTGFNHQWHGKFPKEPYDKPLTD